MMNSGLKVPVVVLATVLLAFVCQHTQATDVSSGVRDRKEHQDWASFEVRGPYYGMFIMGRAATVAKKTSNPETTLALSSRIANRFTFCEESAELIIERRRGDRLGINRKSKVQMSVDGGPFQTVPVTATAEKGDAWLYMDIPKDYRQVLLAGRKSLSVQNTRSKVTEFSLLGMEAAWSEAKDSCAAFACPIGATCQ